MNGENLHFKYWLISLFARDFERSDTFLAKEVRVEHLTNIKKLVIWWWLCGLLPSSALRVILEKCWEAFAQGDRVEFSVSLTSLSPPSRLALVHRTRWFNFYNLQIYGICLVSRCFECEMSWSCILIAFHKLHLVRLPTRSLSCFDRLSTQVLLIAKLYSNTYFIVWLHSGVCHSL